MNAETRAKELMRQFYDELEYVSATHADDMERRIAQALRQAQNDKLEEAARMFEAEDDWWSMKPDELASRIRSLKSKD